jgi:hypothetical protein
MMFVRNGILIPVAMLLLRTADPSTLGRRLDGHLRDASADAVVRHFWGDTLPIIIAPVVSSTRSHLEGNQEISARLLV